MKTRQINHNNLDVKFKQDYLNIDHSIAISSEGIIFKIGDIVGHEGAEDNETAEIVKFSIDFNSYDVIAHTTKGWGRISFMYHPKFMKIEENQCYLCKETESQVTTLMKEGDRFVCDNCLINR